MPSATKRSGDALDDENGVHAALTHHPAKHLKVERSNADDVNGDSEGNAAHNDQRPDFNVSGKKKSAGSTRTGQACDRCKIRKIRCDARPGGCSPCLQNNTECRTTDRITGRATSRGHTEQIENENTLLKMYMLELQQQLRENGVEPKAPPTTPQGQYVVGYWGQTSGNWDMQQPPTMLNQPTEQARERRGSQSALLPEFRPGCIGDNYLGVSSENNWLSPIEGTSLALFGTKIDIAEFMPSETDPAEIPMSYHTFLSYAFGKAQPYVPALPPYQQCKIYSDWYFRSVQQFIPILHKPDFMRLLERIYHEGYQPNPAETVMVHIVLAVINYQFSVRNGNEQARHDAMSNYHYACSFIPDLVMRHKLEDIQALILICIQLRNHPRPGAAWMFTNMVMGLAIESGLHRSAQAWQGSALTQEPHHLEMRKRLFWGLMVLHVQISGKLGRPLPLHVEDFDIEIPEPVPDNLPGENPTSTWKKCSWRAGSTGFKILRIKMQVLSSIYSIRSTGQYETTLRALDKDLEAFQESVPLELRGGPESTDEDRVTGLYVEMSMAQCQLMLHHPALCRSSSAEIMNSNLDTCLYWSGRLLSAAQQLKDFKSLDTTWYYAADFLAAIFTTLFASTERKDLMTSADLQRLRQDMDSWLDVMGEVGTLLGTGLRLQVAVRGIVDFSIGNISRHIATKTASAAVASTVSPNSQGQRPSDHVYGATHSSENYYTNGARNGDNTGHAPSYAESNHAQPQTQYSASDQFSYSTPQTNSMAYAANTIADFDAAAAFSADTEDKPNIDAELVSNNGAMVPQQSASANFMTAFQPSSQVTNGFQHSPHVGLISSPSPFPHSGPAAWRHFADNMMTNVNGQDYMHTAGALMALGASQKNDVSVDMAAATMGSLQMPPRGADQPWPLICYEGPHDQEQQQ